jgi:acyl-CoA synthetase (NDP forming)
VSITATSAHRLASLFGARSIAVIGASERNQYAAIAIRNLQGLNYSGSLHMVNPRGGTVFGRRTAASCGAIAEAVDTAYVCVPIAAVLDAVSEAAQAGIKNFVVLSSGFAETGGDGIELQARLVELCAQHQLRLLGPNCLGFVNYTGGVSLGSIPTRLPQPPASVAIVSASGATAAQLAHFAHQSGIGTTHVIATGNEANITTADCLDYLISQAEVKAVAVFLEMVRDAAQFAAVARRALESRKAIVVLKVGASPTTAAVAAAHTAALVGDDRVFDAVSDPLGIVRVASFEHLVTTAAAMANIGPLDKSGVACISISGGACEVMADLAQAASVSLPQFEPETHAALRGVVSELGQSHNPLDLTGAAIRDPSLWEKILHIVSRDPQIGLTLCNFEPPSIAGGPLGPMLDSIAKGLRGAGSKVGLITSYIAPVNEQGLHYLAENRLAPPIQGLGDGMAAVGKLLWWSERLRHEWRAAPTAAVSAACGTRPQSEHQVLEYLWSRGVPVVPHVLVTDSAAAVAAARASGSAVAMKIASPDIAHKTDIGGVLLNQQGDAAVAAGFHQIMKRVVEARPAARLDGILVAPMRHGGVELIIGISRDPQWGLMMALGLGGIWVEILGDTCLRILPVDHADVLAALRSLRAAKLLVGYRGAPAADFEILADVIVKLGAAALALGPDLAALEINPLLVNGDRVEALDALAVWQ